ncbi:MAG: hypothetical protein GXP45_08530 [bacterium]|nr:hypothetical protein [bacterium]
METKRGQISFYPQNFLTKHEALYILGNLSKHPFVYDQTSADQEYISKGELVHDIVTAFDFSKPQKYRENNSQNQNFLE